MATVQSLLFFAFTVLSLSSQMIIVAKPSSPRRLVMNLIHRDSPHSPYHRKNETLTTRIQRTMAIGGLFADLYPLDVGLFLVNFSIGQPPVPQLAVMDTGSSLLWVKCRPYCPQCSEQYFPIFDSQKSSTFTRLPCTSKNCIYAQPRYTTCTSFDPCKYNQTYAGGSYSTGVLAKEQLLFQTFDEGLAVVKDVIFGCGTLNGKVGKLANGPMSGIFGLGFKEISLATRFSKFSYCIGNVFDPYYRFNQLVMGTDDWTEGDSTPLQVINGFYHVDLEGISVGETSIPIDINPFRWNGKAYSGVIIDSGSVATSLIKEGYDPLVKTVQSLLDPWLTQIHGMKDVLCYHGNINQALQGFPTVTFHFHGGAELVLDTQSLFYQFESNGFCMAVLPSYAREKFANISVIGLLAQQNYNVIYDISRNSLSFLRIDCDLLLD